MRNRARRKARRSCSISSPTPSTAASSRRRVAATIGDEGVDPEIQSPGESTDAPKLLGAGKVEFAILDIHDLGIARERGIDLVGLIPIVQRPLAAILARS